jgi:hypothetical protein
MMVGSSGSGGDVKTYTLTFVDNSGHGGILWANGKEYVLNKDFSYGGSDVIEIVGAQTIVLWSSGSSALWEKGYGDCISDKIYECWDDMRYGMCGIYHISGDGTEGMFGCSD